MKIGDKVKVVKDNYLGDDLDSLRACGVEVGDTGIVLDIDEDLGIKDSIVVQFPDSTLSVSPDELEVIAE